MDSHDINGAFDRKREEVQKSGHTAEKKQNDIDTLDIAQHCVRQLEIVALSLDSIADSLNTISAFGIFCHEGKKG